MSRLIRNGNVVADEWKVLRLAEGDTAQSVKLPVGPVLVPLSVWQVRRWELIHREYEHGWALGVWLAADENPQAIENDIDDFSVIAIEFDKFSGGDYLVQRVLRERYGYQGELRATGDVVPGKADSLVQAGFDTIELRTAQQAKTAFSDSFDLGRRGSGLRQLAA